MKYFIIKSNTSCIDNVNPKSPASSGRLDVILDFIIESLNLRNDVRRDVTVYALLAGCEEYVMEVSGKDLRRPIHSEYELLNLIASRKLKIWRENFQNLLQRLLSNGVKLYYLHERGEPVSKFRFIGSVGFIIGDQDGLTASDEKIINDLGIPWISLNSIPYLSWYCSVIINALLDKV